MSKKNMLKKAIRYSIILLVLAIILPNLFVELGSRKFTYDELIEIPYNKVGLVLGTTKNTVSGHLNPYYIHRISAAVALFNSGKVDYLLVSGDNSETYYNEPISMMNDLIEQGIPEDRIYLDYAGFRTLDSIVRSKEIFGQESITIISQEFHNKRAISIAHFKGIEAVGYNAKDVSFRIGLKTNFREIFARVKMVYDLIFNKQPRFLGETIDI
ncbi:MAG: ElyC/SanA/YdcF family protein [Eubacteriales bacterium]|nr:ElyC/SanA/YdcF family protein [Eubacteriales bacterium]